MDQTMRFELRVTIDVPMEDGECSYTPLSLEKHMLAVLRKVDGDVFDLEVMETSVIGDEPDPREKGDDDGREYGDPRDAREERLR